MALLYLLIVLTVYASGFSQGPIDVVSHGTSLLHQPANFLRLDVIVSNIK